MPQVRDLTVAEAVDELAVEHEATAIRYRDREVSFADLAETGSLFADGLAALGHEKGDPGGIWLPNRPEWFESYVGFAGIGAPVVAVNTRYRSRELEYVLEDSETTTLVVQASLLTRDFLELLREVCPAVDEVPPGKLAGATDLALERVVVLDPGGDADLPEAAYTYEEILERGREADDPADDVAVTPDDYAAVFYTSGTTSRPKGVVHDHVSVVNHPRMVAERLAVTPADTALAIIPVCGVAGFDFAWSTLLAGGTLVLQPSFDPEAAASAVESESVTYIVAVGEVMDGILATDHDVTSLERGTVYLTDEDQLATIESACEFPVTQPYGLSEGHSHLTVSPPDAPAEERYAPGGPPVHEDVRMQIRDPRTGNPLGAGERGELYIRGYNRMEAYLNKPDRTAEDVDDGWLVTGDLCELDEQGRLLYHSRIEDMLRLRGFRVTPREIERVLEDHEAVDRAQVVGVRQGDGNDVAVAFVRRSGVRTVSGGDLEEFMTDRVASYKVPSEFVFVESFPTTESPNGEKIRRSELADRASDVVGAGQDA